MNNVQLSVLCLVITLGIYFANKRLYRRFRKLPLMPLVLTPALLVLMLVFGHISWQNYIGESHWLLWLLGPATIAFAPRQSLVPFPRLIPATWQPDYNI